ncbi:hypothetical protein K469DRAFT_32473 [Zopfia rhizophila CBS 207.26]|uniref:Uncharacterized protein n=1 Tax=Zopfia rhizophila CBS 207.26 TaxID=1314779 RepID=A0A6A6DA97_9PEZI|nr:hypothetical protein K469DRAFT_32473 [Zopfia rhizophila CBS 207.26]
MEGKCSSDGRNHRRPTPGLTIIWHCCIASIFFSERALRSGDPAAFIDIFDRLTGVRSRASKPSRSASCRLLTWVLFTFMDQAELQCSQGKCFDWLEDTTFEFCCTAGE